MKKIIIAIVALLFCGVVYSQTPYQSKCLEIYKKYLRIYSAGSLSNAELENVFMAIKMAGVYPNDYESATKEMAFAASKLNYMLTHSESAVAELDKRMKAEFEAAKKLMDNDEKLGYKILLESKTPYGKAKWDGATAFVKWARRDEYESNKDWENRLHQQAANVFDSIMYKYVRETIKDDYWCMDYGRYHADEGVLSLLFYDNSGVNGCGHRITISPQEAKNLKENNPMSKEHVTFYRGGVEQKSGGAQELSFYYYYDEICKVEDDDAALIPRYFYIDIASKEYKFDNKNFITSVKLEVSDVKYKFDDLITDSRLQFLKGHVFSYKQYYDNIKERELLALREQAKRDSIAKREKFLKDSLDYIKYSKMIDSVYNEYNHDLEVDKYNIDNYRISTKVSISITAPATSYQEALEKLQDEKNKQQKEIKSLHDKYWKDYGNGICYQTLNEFDDYYCKGSQVFNKETYLRSSLYQLKKDAIIVSMLDIQNDIAFVPKSDIEASLLGQKMIDFSTFSNSRTKVLTMVAILQNSTHYKDAVTFMIDNNKALNKEFVKNGSKFTSPEEFYNAYISENYKNILKSK